ncbi:MAG: sulfotransferase, partial [Polyangiales bacterium]
MPRTKAPRGRPLRANQFTSASAILPWWLQAVNGLGRLFPRSYAPSASAWFAKARRAHADAGTPGPETVEALEALVDSLRTDASLSFSGRIAAGMDCVRMAEQHLRLEHALRASPGILETTLPSPIFLIGWMRTGTTFVHRLLSRDPDNRFMPYWESMYPIPPTGGDDRVEQLEHVLGQLASISPNYQAIHPMSATAPEECVALFTNVFRTLQYNVQYHVPSYVEWLEDQDPRVAYRHYRRQLQFVHHHRPVGQRFVLKDPTHSVWVSTILELFPDARFIITHREPADAFSSMASLYAYSRAIFSDRVDPHAIGPELVNGYLLPSMGRALRVVDSLPAGRVAHIR